MSDVENSLNLNLDFTKLRKVIENCKSDVIPAVAQCIDTGDILIVAYVNDLALKTSLEKGIATFWSTSRDKLWIKGETSGDYLELVDILVNCEQNSIVYRVRLKGSGSCHTTKKDGMTRYGCYYRRIVEKDGKLALEFLAGEE